MKRILTAVTLAIFAAAPGNASAQPKIDDIVKKIEARFEPAEAKPGQVVTLKIEVELLEGWWTYPTAQLDKGAKGQVVQFKLPKDGPAIFVGKPIDPANPKSKAEPTVGIEKMLYYPGGGTFEHKVVVSPKATAGKADIKFVAKLLVCDKDFCLTEKFDLTAKLKIVEGSVPVDPKYKDEVEKALQK